MNHPLNTRRYTELVSKISYAISLVCTYLEKKIKEMDKKEELEKQILVLNEEVSMLKKEYFDLAKKTYFDDVE